MPKNLRRLASSASQASKDDGTASGNSSYALATGNTQSVDGANANANANRSGSVASSIHMMDVSPSPSPSGASAGFGNLRSS